MNILKDPDFQFRQTVKHFTIDRKAVERTHCGAERGEFAEYAIDDDCSDCGALTGFFHTLGCDLEQCPVCLGQALSCGCKYKQRPEEILRSGKID